MDAEPDLDRIAGTIGDATRIRMLMLLMEGRALTAKELAHGACVEPSTATAHLRRLLSDALVVSTAQGRHKYFRLASPQVAQCVESLLAIAAPRDSGVTALPQQAIHKARFCYDHLAGRLGVRLAESLVGRGLLTCKGKAFEVPAKGERWFTRFGIDLGAVAAARRTFACPCLDWSERKDHLGGALGAALARQMLEKGWLKRRPGSRVVAITERGREGLDKQFGISWE